MINRLIARFCEWNRDPYYEDSKIHNTQFVGRVPKSERQFAEVLNDLSFEELSGPPASSWRRTSDEDQLHVVFYDGERLVTGDSGYSYVYAHREIKPSVAPLKHLSGETKNGGEGVREMKKMLDEYGVGYEPIRP